jgi:hypothetical protein
MPEYRCVKCKGRFLFYSPRDYYNCCEKDIKKEWTIEGDKVANFKTQEDR